MKRAQLYTYTRVIKNAFYAEYLGPVQPPEFRLLHGAFRMEALTFGHRDRVEACMPISPGYLPSELHYIVALAERHGSNARVAQYDRRLGRHVQYAETLSEADIEPLRHLYAEICNKGHGPLINGWHQNHECNGTCPPETTWPIFGILCLFLQLGGLGTVPFNDGAISPHG